MLEIYERVGHQTEDVVDVHLVLNHEQREKGRLRTISAEGEEVRLFLERGKPLQIGELLRSQCGRHVVVEGAYEPVITAMCDDWETFSRACYHLGNRHVKLQIGTQWLRILPDHVLEEMLVMLGMTIRQDNAVFVPESGAYGNHGAHSH